MKSIRRIKAGVYQIHGVYVVRETIRITTEGRGGEGGERNEEIWVAYQYLDRDEPVDHLPGDWRSLSEARAALRPRPGKLGTLSAPSYQILTSFGVEPGISVLVRSDYDSRVGHWTPVKVEGVREDGFVFMSFI